MRYYATNQANLHESQYSCSGLDRGGQYGVMPGEKSRLGARFAGGACPVLRGFGDQLDCDELDKDQIQCHPKERSVANCEHKAYPNIRETPFYSPEGRLARFLAMGNQPSVRVTAAVIRMKYVLAI